MKRGQVRTSACLIAAFGVVTSGAFAQGALHDPEDRVVRYNSSLDLTDPVANLQKRLQMGTARLDFEPRHGYLISLLTALNVPISSQTLVFSKTSSQARWTSPKTPRALYFNDNVYIGWAPGAETLDISDIDPQKGPIFYTLDQRPSSKPCFIRRTECMQCHIGPKTLNVPGYLLRSMYVAPNGNPIAQVSSFATGHEAALNTRWGGWYVTGTVSEAHMGNSFVREGERQENLAAGTRASLTEVKPEFDSLRYLSPASDVVALLLLSHQVKLHNLITRASYETRYALAEQTVAQKDVKAAAGQMTETTKRRIANVAEPLLQYMLFRNEAPLNGPIGTTSLFAKEFQLDGPRDSKGRSLRELDLKTRLLRYPCSYIIYSDAFDSLPQQLKDYLWQRLFEILSGRDRSKPYASMSPQDRETVLEILRETKPEFAAWLAK